jgi:hypothetical protein
VATYPCRELGGGGLLASEAGDGVDGLGGPFLLPQVPAAAGELDGLGGVGEPEPAGHGGDLEHTAFFAAVAPAALAVRGGDLPLAPGPGTPPGWARPRPAAPAHQREGCEDAPARERSGMMTRQARSPVVVMRHRQSRDLGNRARTALNTPRPAPRSSTGHHAALPGPWPAGDRHHRPHALSSRGGAGEIHPVARRESRSSTPGVNVYRTACQSTTSHDVSCHQTQLPRNRP